MISNKKNSNKAQNQMPQENTGSSGKFPFAMTLKALIFYIFALVLMGLYLVFIRGGTTGITCACVVCPLMIAYLIYAYRKEQRADKNAWHNNNRLIDGSYFDSPAWHDEYVKYAYEHPFERPECDSMKSDLLKRFQRREYMVGMLFMLFLIICSFCGIPMKKYAVTVIGTVLFGFIFYLELALFIGMPVRKWLKSNIDYNVLESSYLSSRMLLYKKNGLALGTTHIHGFTEKEVYAVDYRQTEGISRKIVRLKKYEDGIYSSEEYKHYAVIHVRLPQSGGIQDVEIELNEYQVQMAIDEFYTYKLGKQPQGNLTRSDGKCNESVM